MVTLNPKCLIITIPLKIAVLHLICGPLPCLSPHENCHLTDIPIYPMFRYTLGQSGEKKQVQNQWFPQGGNRKGIKKTQTKVRMPKAPMRKLTIEQSSPKWGENQRFGCKIWYHSPWEQPFKITFSLHPPGFHMAICSSPVQWRCPSRRQRIPGRPGVQQQPCDVQVATARAVVEWRQAILIRLVGKSLALQQHPNNLQMALTARRMQGRFLGGKETKMW